MTYYKGKYEEEAAVNKKMVKIESEFKLVKVELDSKNKEFTAKVSELQGQLSKSEKNN